MNWEKTFITIASGERVEAQAPVIISASRSTDIPAFYADWFVERLKANYLRWTNPFNQAPLYVTFANARLVVFWSKNPKPVIAHLDFIREKIPNCYFQFTLNDYVAEKLEPNVPDVESRIDTFIELSEKIGKEKVIWRFDPLILTDKIGVDELLRKLEHIGSQLKQHTSKLVFSFADIQVYRKVQNNLKRSEVIYQDFDQKTMTEFAQGLHELNKSWKLEIGTCAEKIPLEKYGITHNKCIDDELMIKLFPNDKKLMDFLGVKITPPDMFNPQSRIERKRNMKDKGQRQLCGCVFSKDIGAYNTCAHLCEYCYANASKALAIRNWHHHLENKAGETITGN